MLVEWCRFVERYSDVTEGDICVDYTERASVGTLAAAVWKVGGVALEEFQWDKGRGGRKTGNGRADLWIQCDAKRPKHEYVEVKRTRLSLKSKRNVEFAQRALVHAVEDARKTIYTEPESNAVALAFLPVRLLEKDRKALPVLIERQCNEFLKARKSELKFDAIAWCFPARNQEYVDDTYITPGAILLAKKI